MLESELNNQNAGDGESNGRDAGQAAAVPAAVFQAPQVLFQAPPPPAPVTGGSAGSESGQGGGAGDGGSADGGAAADRRGSARGGTARSRTSRAVKGSGSDEDHARSGDRGDAGPAGDTGGDAGRSAADKTAGAGSGAGQAGDVGDVEDGPGGRRRRRRNTRTRGKPDGAGDGADADGQDVAAAPSGQAKGSAQAKAQAGDDEGARAALSARGESADDTGDAESGEDGDAGAADESGSGRRRRRKRRRSSADGDVPAPDDPPDTVVHVREPHSLADDVRSVKGSTRLEAKKQRRREGRESGRRRPPIVTESEFLARRESVERTMVVRQRGDRTQIAVLEDGVLVEHYVNRTTHQSYVGNVYLGKVQNVLPSMEAAFVDIGKGRNAVLYAGEVNFDASGLEGQPKRIESALKAAQSVIVQVTKDPVGHKGARLTSLVSLPGRYLVYVPGASMTGISRKLPDTERNRLKQILKKVMPENAGVIVRTAAEGASEEELARDVARLAAQWENIERKAKTASAPALLYSEPDLTIRVVRDVFNEDFSELIVSGDEDWDVIDEYVRYVAPHLAGRLGRWPGDSGAGGQDVFAAYRIDEQLAKALERKVWLPSGGSLVIDRTEAMTVIDVNTGKFTGQGGNLEETVTRNNLEAAEEIVRQLRLRDVGGIVVIDFIDMVLESNRELVLRRLLECLARDRTKHQVAEVTSLGLVQMTRKRVGAGLLEAFSEPCECCNGRGLIITLDQPEQQGHRSAPATGSAHRRSGSGQDGGRAGRDNGRNGHSDRKPGQDNGRGARRDDRPAADRPAAAPAAGPNAAEPVAADAAPADAAAASSVPADSVPADSAPASPVAATPGRRTRAGSAVARRASTADPAPAAAQAEETVALPVTFSDAIAAADAAVAGDMDATAEAAQDADLGTSRRAPLIRRRRRKTAPDAPTADPGDPGPAAAGQPADQS